MSAAPPIFRRLMGERITSQIEADPAEVARIRAARREAREMGARRCDSSVKWGASPTLTCERRLGHRGAHGAGVHSWTRHDEL